MTYSNQFLFTSDLANYGAEVSTVYVPHLDRYETVFFNEDGPISNAVVSMTPDSAVSTHSQVVADNLVEPFHELER